MAAKPRGTRTRSIIHPQQRCFKYNLQKTIIIIALRKIQGDYFEWDSSDLYFFVI